VATAFSTGSESQQHQHYTATVINTSEKSEQQQHLTSTKDTIATAINASKEGISILYKIFHSSAITDCILWPTAIIKFYALFKWNTSVIVIYIRKGCEV
jgi:hypothetical protein